MKSIGIDIGSETIKIIGIEFQNNEFIINSKICIEHHKKPLASIDKLIAEIHIDDFDYICSTGRYSHLLKYYQIPEKEARIKGFRYLFPKIESASIISIGSHGYSLLELFADGKDVIHHNPNCSQGSGNFLCQLIERLDFSLEQADIISERIISPLKIKGRCPVIMKTNLTHLANNGEDKVRIIAALFDSIADNAISLIRPGISPEKVYLAGGVCRLKRVRAKIEEFLKKNNMNLITDNSDNSIFIDAIGSAIYAFENKLKYSSQNQIDSENTILEKLPALNKYLSKVNRLIPEIQNGLDKGIVILGFDIGSTGSKLVAFDINRNKIIYNDYINTDGDPVLSTKRLIENFLDKTSNEMKVIGFGVTGSGRDIAGALLGGFFGINSVYSRNEIIAHSEGALYYDKNVDTIFEIGGQDSKYIRLENGNVVDVALNESCSAGTGSFIEEQGKRFEGIENVENLNLLAMDAENTINLGRHCSVFMADMIEQALGLGYENNEIIAGIYYSVVQNYLQRVVSNKSIGNHIFCQGMTFQSTALASAMSMQLKKNIIIPPNPGATGALGIAILANKNLTLTEDYYHDISKFKNVKDIKKDSFVCKSTSGCSKPGNCCKIDKLSYHIKGNPKVMYWGGVCSLWKENSGNENKFPESMMDVFKLRENYIKEFISNLKTKNNQKKVAITDKFQLKELFPFFVTFINELGFNIITEDISNEDALKIGMNNSDVLFCSPMMIYTGIIHSFIEKEVDYIFMPSLIDSQRKGNENYSKLCPIVQGSSSIISKSLNSNHQDRIISPTIEIGLRNLQSNEFLQSCENLAKLLGCDKQKWKNAYKSALKSQSDFTDYRRKIGISVLQSCKLKGITPIVVIGKTYSIYNDILNSGVPKILQSLGVMPIPVDCYQGDAITNDFNNIYWSCGQESIRAAKQISKTSGIYALFCTNYGCGPDSFIQHFFQDIMKQKPYMIIDNDVRSGDNGIKTRLEAFLDCISNHKQTVDLSLKPYNRNNYLPLNISIEEIIRNKTKLLVPYLGPASEVFASALRGSGILAESLPMPDKTTIETGRLYTSGKECSPMNTTLGSLLMYVERNSGKNEKYIYFMPGSDGPCRFGMYNILHKIFIDNIGMADKIQILSSGNNNFIQDVPKGLFIIVYIALCIIDAMNWCLHYTRPVENIKGKSDEIFKKNMDLLIKHLENINSKNISSKKIIFQIISGQLFGCSDILKNAAKEFNAIKKDVSIPTVSIDGALYVRCDPFSSNFLIDKLEKSGIRTLPAQFFDWLEFLDSYEDKIKSPNISSIFNQFLKYRIKETANLIINKNLGCPKIPHINAEINAVKPYLNIKLMSESMLSVGKSIVLKRNGEIDSLILVSPHECMQSKITESFLNIIDINENLYSKSMQFNNDIIDIETMNSLVFEIKKRYKQEKGNED